MSDTSPPLSSRLSPHGLATPSRAGRLLDAIARVPLPVVAVLLVLGGILAGLQLVLIDAVHNAGGEEPPQWVARLTVMQVNIVVPLALIMMWARRRSAQGKLGFIAAALLVVLPVVHVGLTIATIIWGGVLGRGDLQFPVTAIEWLGLLSYAGLLLSGIAWMLDKGAPRLIGPLIVVGFALNYLIPWGLLIGYGLLAVVVLRTGLSRKGRASRRTTAVS